MDFRQTSQPNSGRPPAVATAPVAIEHKEMPKPAEQKKSNTSWLRILNVTILIGVAVLLIGIALTFTRGSGENEFRYVTKGSYQAVFLNNGQVYFGYIDSLNGKYLHMTNIYYLTQTNDTASGNYSLVKLGCQQIHDPFDAMVINRDQVSFWENLNGESNNKVVSSIKQYQDLNKNKNRADLCAQVSTQTQASSSATQGATSSTGTSGTSTTGTGTTSTGSTTTK